jgi:hypothetical protein
MTLQLADAVADGIGRALTTTGGIVFGLLLATQLLLLASMNTVLAAQLPPETTDVLGLTLPVSGTVAGVLLVGTFLATTAYFVVVARALTRPRAELSSFPRSLYTRRMGRATLSMLVGSVLIFFAVMIGFAFLILPGIFLAACFLFFIFAVGAEDRGVIAALKRSWALARGNRLRLGAFVLVIGIAGGILGVPAAVFQAAGEPLIGDLVTGFVNSLMFTLVYGIMASMYVQLRDGREHGGGAQPSPLGQTAD